MPRYSIEQVWERLVLHINNRNVAALRSELNSCEKLGFRKEQIVNFSDSSNCHTVLHLAASNGQVDCLRLLLYNGGNPNALSLDDFGQTPLHLAAQEGHHICIEVLLEYGANINIRNSLQSTPQDFVQGNFQCETVFQLAKAKQGIPDRTSGDQNRVQALHEFISTAHDEFCELYNLLPLHYWDLGTRWNDFYDQTLLYRAANEEQEEIVKLIISKSSNQPLPNVSDNRTPLMASCWRQNIKISELLLEHSPGLIFISEAKEKHSPLHIACSLGNLQILKLIFKAFKFYIKSRSTENSNLTLDFYDIDGKTPLYSACSAGHYDIVKALIAFHRENAEFVSLNVNALVHKSRRSNLHAAIHNENVDMVGLLLSVQSINVNHKGKPSRETISKLISLFKEINFVEDVNSGLGRRAARTQSAKKIASRSKDIHSKSGNFRERFFSTIDKKTRDEMGVFENIESGELIVAAIKDFKQHQKYKNLNAFFITPLAEAAACANSKIVKLLLLHGARDENGLACRILWMLLRLDIMQNILSYHIWCSCSTSWNIENSSTCVELNWSHRGLPVCHEKWLEKDAKFYINTAKIEKEVVNSLTHSCHESQDIKRYDLQLCPESQYKHHLVLTSSSLNTVSLVGNQISLLPLQLFQLPNMHSLDVSDNKIIQLPVTSSSDITDTKLDKKMLASWSCFNLRELNISSNKLSVLPCCLWELQNLCVLDCSKNTLEKLLPENVTSFEKVYVSKLKMVNLSKNCLSGKIPDFIFEFPSLKLLDLSCNKIDELPGSIWTNETLEELNITDNSIISLPFCEPENVYQELYCQKKENTIKRQESMSAIGETTPRSRNNSESVLTQSVSAMDLHSPTRMTSFSLLTVSHSYAYSALKKLNVSGNKISKFPEGLPCFAPNLRELDISDNSDLKKIDVIFLPSSLQILLARNCGLNNIGNLTLKEVRASMVKNCRKSKNNFQVCTHRSHINLQFLTKFDLSGNELFNLQLIRYHPLETEHDITKKTMEELNYIPDVSSHDLLYPSLEILYLSDNCLTDTFNPNIGHQMKLHQIDLSNNHLLKVIPLEFAYLMKKRKQVLNELKINNLPSLVDPPAEYARAKLNRLLGYLKSKLKASDYYRSIKLFFVGNGERGKTTLLRRLQGLSEDKKVDRTVGIDIEPWIFPDHNLDKNDKRKPVKFLAWDFAGQDIYHTTHQCFYSKRSLYLALFRLTDREAGIDELHKWLKNINLRAPGSPVIIVGTHLDQISDQRIVKMLEDEVQRRYFNNPSYPKVVDMMFVSCMRKKFSFKSKVKDLRNKIYDIACHLVLEGSNLNYKPTMSEEDPKALFQQKVPSVFLTLQEHIEKKTKEMNDRRLPPVMEEEEFRKTFTCTVSDDEELDEAVFFLHLQGSILHFDDHSLKHVYFLDPQWLPKMMADVIYPATKENRSVAKLEDLFYHRNTMRSLKDHFINYMEKFEVVLRINPDEVVIPCCMNESQLPIPEEILHNISSSTFYDENGDCYPPLRRFWLSNFVPDGFWSRLICAVYKDPQIIKILTSVIGLDASNTTSNTVTYFGSFTTVTNTSSNLYLSFWKTGLAFGYKNKVFLTMMQEENNTENFDTPLDSEVNFVKSNLRIELHIFTNEWLALSNYLIKTGQESDYTHANSRFISGLATKILLLLTVHLKKLSTDYFLGMIERPATEFCTYMACWKCFSDSSESEETSKDVSGLFMMKDGSPRSVYIVEDHIHTQPEKQFIECCVHGKLQFKEQAPELIFWDLTSELECDNSSDLKVFDEEILGQGGYGVVFKGELCTRTNQDSHQKSTVNVAVKCFLKDATSYLQVFSFSEILERLNTPTQLLHAYQEVRQEVSFLSILSHPNLTKLYGVKTSPYPCVILEMAPGKSLDHMLKDYYGCGEVLEPVTLKEASLQIAQGLEYLHSNQRVHLDIKSSNILLWKFPSPHLSHADRLKESKNVMLKIADYGISQVSIGLTLNTQSTGTPGYMAPEHLKAAKGTISSDKLDVFAYAMVLFELLSQSAPFPKGTNPDQDIQDGKRPQLDSKKARSPILLQELICRCWDHEPDNRPKMEEVVKCIQMPEFEKLRDEVYIENISSISSACVCCYNPHNEISVSSSVSVLEDSTIHKGSVFHKIKKFENFSKRNTGQTRTEKELTEIKGQKQEIVLIKNTLSSDDLQNVTTNSIMSYELPFLNKHTSGYSVHQDNGSLNKISLISSTEFTLNDQSSNISDSSAKSMDPYSQIWFSAYIGNKINILNIFTFVDNNPEYYNFSECLSGDEITSICPVGNMMWIGTISGEIKIFHAPTLQIKFTCSLQSEEPYVVQDFSVLKILYVEETRRVLISTSSGYIWSFFDSVAEGCLKLQCKLRLNSPCYDLVQVILGKGNVMVCGAVANNQILILKSNHESTWTEHLYTVEPSNPTLTECSHITCISFSSSGVEVRHVWISYKLKPFLISFDVFTEKQLSVLDCTQVFSTEADQFGQITNLLSLNQRILVSTTTGYVGIIDTENRQPIQLLKCHDGEIFQTLSLPHQVAPIMCVEMSFQKSKQHSRDSALGDEQKDTPLTMEDLSPGSVQSSRMFENNCMVATIGNGRYSYFSQTQGNADQASSYQDSDLFLRIWKT